MGIALEVLRRSHGVARGTHKAAEAPSVVLPAYDPGNSAWQYATTQGVDVAGLAGDHGRRGVDHPEVELSLRVALVDGRVGRRSDDRVGAHAEAGGERLAAGLGHGGAVDGAGDLAPCCGGAREWHRLERGGWWCITQELSNHHAVPVLMDGATA